MELFSIDFDSIRFKKFDRIELDIYLKRPSDPMDFKAKKAFNSSSVESNHKNLKKMPKKIKKSNFSAELFPHF